MDDGERSLCTALETGTLLNKPDSSEKLFLISVILRHEEPVSSVADALYLSMTEVKKLETNSGTTEPLKN